LNRHRRAFLFLIAVNSIQPKIRTRSSKLALIPVFTNTFLTGTRLDFGVILGALFGLPG
jgi:hypothetical protein